MENTINTTGRWSFTGEGIQELSGNYFSVALPPGEYKIQMEADAGNMLLTGIGIRGTEADEFSLGRSGVINTQGYDYYYLMVFNPRYDDNVNDCQYESYAINVQPTVGSPAALLRTWDATQFQPLVQN